MDRPTLDEYRRAYELLLATDKEPAVGAVVCCGLTFTLDSTVAGVTMVTQCPRCGQVWEVLSTCD